MKEKIGAITGMKEGRTKESKRKKEIETITGRKGGRTKKESLRKKVKRTRKKEIEKV